MKNNIEELREWFYYDPTSPSGLRWKKEQFIGMYRNILVKV